MRDKKKLIIVISAPSGAGKTTVVNELFKTLRGIKRSISFTTRPPKHGEKNKVDYIFISKKEFEQRIKSNGFVEYAKVHSFFYGTSIYALKHLKNNDLILNIDVQGGISVKKKFPDAILIFLMPPSFIELKKRLLKRGRDSKKEIAERINNAKKEIEFAPKYDYIVVNDRLKIAVGKIKEIIISERKKLKLKT